MNKNVFRICTIVFSFFVFSFIGVSVSLAQGCQSVDLSAGTIYTHTINDSYKCNGYQNTISSDNLVLKCQSGWAHWRNFWVKEIDVSGSQSVDIKANLNINDGGFFASTCGSTGGVKYDDYSDLIVLSSDPSPNLNSECNQAVSPSDWPKCSVSNDATNVLGHCGIPKCGGSRGCDFKVNTSGLNKVYLVFRASDPWTATVKVEISNLKICGIEKVVTPTLSDGSYCNSSLECNSGNCQNYRCCIKGKTCCSSTNNCPREYYCSEDKNYCMLGLPDGQSCSQKNQCKSGNCQNKTCCAWGQTCCKNDSDCDRNDYCQTSTSYCKDKLAMGEICGNYGSKMCASGYCSPENWKCAEESSVKKEQPKPLPVKLEMTGKFVCGNKNPEYWLGENCSNCPQDFGLVSGSCCDPGKFFMYPSNYQNKINKFYESLGGIIPSGTFVVPKQMTLIKSFFADYKPQMCSRGKITEGKCVNNWDCPGGICDKNFQCVKTASEEIKKVEDQDLANKIYKKQTAYEISYSRNYNKIKDDINSCAGDRGLKICLEIQGSAVKDKIHEANKGEPVVALLKIENIANYNIAVIPEISLLGVSPTNLNNKIEIKESNMGLDWSGGIYSILGSFLTNLEKMMGGKYVVMPSGSKLITTVKFIPKQMGMLNIQGLVSSTPDAEFANANPGLADIILKPQQYEKNFKKTKVDASIYVKEKPCKWLFCI